MWNFQQTIESALEIRLPQCRRPAAKPLNDAVRYVIFPGGKRIRPMLSLLGARVFVTDVRAALPAACAVEFIHASSLVFDDLPCMDDAHIRRGKCVVHKVFGEEIALLAALALLNQSYAIFGETPAVIVAATACIGVDGMIGGQALDLSASGPAGESSLERDERLSERKRKTSAMMRLAFTAGALACGVSAKDAEVLGRAGQCLGEAFQIGDDLLDARRSSQHTGKNAGQDRRHNRPNHSRLDESAVLARLQAMVADARIGLTAEYGADRIAELMMFVDAMFAKLTAEENIPVAYPTQ
jgi:geranylgeranyl diphosphate synthase, type II